jgi:predicted RNase H-like nuclease/ppGpp synthetase/RelA/SpoT-type nucleotidyltranferase
VSAEEVGDVNFVGIDLAWGERAPSGLAVLDESGTLVHLSRATTEAQIAEALSEYVADECLVGIDAPLVVTNATGNRPCEAALNHDFARFDAGTHPTNTGKPEFSGGPRGARVATLLSLPIDPVQPADRGAVEVYPHAALVALFGLGRTLKYKQRTNRPFPLLHAEMLRLIALIEGLEHARLPLRLAGSASWSAVVAGVAGATRKGELRHAEDQLDAVVCAYVAMLAARRPELITVYGDPETGRIVTPTLPEGLRPSPRKPLTVVAAQAAAAAAASVAALPPLEEDSRTQAGVDLDSLIRESARTYAQLQPQVEELAGRLAAWLTTVLDDAGINYQYIAWRGKSVASFAAKTAKTVDGRPLYSDPLRDITDQIGARVITYVTSDVAAVADVVKDQLGVVRDLDLGQATANEGTFGYVSRHLQVSLDPVWLGTLPTDLVRVSSAQIQIRTVLQHAWAEFEHDIRYKGTIPEALAPDLNRRFTLAAGLLELADREFEVIRDRMRERMAEEAPEADANDPRIGNQELAAFLAGHYPDAGWSRDDHYTWISGLLLELGITSLRELAELLPAVDSAAITDRMGYKYPPGAVRRLDDALLAQFGTRYLGLHGNAHRLDLLRTRLEKLGGDGAAPIS